MAGNVSPSAAHRGGRRPVARRTTPGIARVLEPASPVVTCRVRVGLPSSCWLRALTASDPECAVEVLDRSDGPDQRSMTTARVHGPEGPAREAQLPSLPRVEEIEILAREPAALLLRVRHALQPWSRPALDHGVLYRYPYWVREGEAIWTLSAPSERLRGFLAAISPRVTGISMEALRPGVAPCSDPRWTDRQQELLQRAVAEGYFEVPRRVSLTGLAERLGVSKSTLSERLAIIERRLLLEAAQRISATRGELVARGSPADGPPLEPSVSCGAEAGTRWMPEGNDLLDPVGG
jgi:predicted DNA binding protein